MGRAERVCFSPNVADNQNPRCVQSQEPNGRPIQSEGENLNRSSRANLNKQTKRSGSQNWEPKNQKRSDWDQDEKKQRLDLGLLLGIYMWFCCIEWVGGKAHMGNHWARSEGF